MLDEACAQLESQGQLDTSLKRGLRALHRLEQTARRPFRIAILGEANSGKSTVANRLAGEVALPVLPMANTRLPTLLAYSDIPAASAIYEDGSVHPLTHGRPVAPGRIVRLDVGLPSRSLLGFEILDFPGSANPLYRTDIRAVLAHGIHGAIWATVATQAWKETERAAWSGLPPQVRKWSILAVTHIDLVPGERNLERLQMRLRPVGNSQFSSLCFISSQEGSRSDGSIEIVDKTAKLAKQFEAQRSQKVALLARRISGRLLSHMS